MVRRLAQMLEDPAVRLIFIAPPAGFGKTTLLDAVERCWTAAGEPVERIDGGGLDDSALMARLEEVAGRGLVLVDSFDPSAGFAGRLLQPLIEGERPGKWVIASRTLPDLDWLSAAQAGGRVLRAVDLQLDAIDVEQSIAHLPGGLGSPALAAQIIEVTGGWPVAVGACIDLLSQARCAPTLPELAARVGSDIGPYLERNVLGRLDAELTGFLGELATWDLFSSGMVDEIIGARGVQLLAEAQRRNLLVFPGPEQGMLRLHPLFRSFLLDWAPLSPARRTFLLAETRAWAVRNGRASDAVACSLSLGDLEAAGDMLARNASALIYEHGRLEDLISWVDDLERRGARRSLSLQLWRIWALIFSLRLTEARHAMEALRGWSDLEAQLQAAPEAEAQLEQMACSLALRADDMTSVATLGAAWLERHANASASLRATVEGAVAVSAWARMQETEHRRHLLLARRAAAEANSGYCDAWLTAIEVWTELECGRAATAQRLVDAALIEGRRALGDRSPVIATLSLLAARAACETGALEAAELHLSRGLPHLGDHGLVETAVAGLAALVAMVERRIGADAALAELRRQANAGHRFARRFEEETAILAIGVMLRAGDARGARQELETQISTRGLQSPPQADAQVWAAQRSNLGAVEAAILLREGRAPEALPILSTLVQEAEAHGRVRRQVELLVLRAYAQRSVGSTAKASITFGRALALSEARGFLQTVCDVGWAARPFLRGAGAQRPGVFAAALRERLGLTAATSDEEVPALTEREHDILRCLDAGLNNQRVAETLGLSIATVKWHAQNVYAKLGVANRSAALAKARRFALLTDRPGSSAGPWLALSA
jgi:LuxR family maltose regulon positive regulatory protein